MEKKAECNHSFEACAALKMFSEARVARTDALQALGQNNIWMKNLFLTGTCRGRLES